LDERAADCPVPAERADGDGGSGAVMAKGVAGEPRLYLQQMETAATSAAVFLLALEEHFGAAS
jgi:hypothetical protein